MQGVRLAYAEETTDLQPLEAWRDLRFLTFEGHYVDDEALAPLGSLGSLWMLEMGIRPFETNDVTDEGLRHISGLRNLKYLGMRSFSGVRGEGLRHLLGMRNLTELELAETGITDHSMRHLAALTNLRALSLQRTRITNAGLEELAALPNLTTLDLRETKITAEVVQILSQFPSLSASCCTTRASQRSSRRCVRRACRLMASGGARAVWVVRSSRACTIPARVASAPSS